MTNTATTNKNTGTVFIVFRDDNRVSDKEHYKKEDAQSEADFWIRGIKKYPDGTKVTIREVPAKN